MKTSSDGKLNDGFSALLRFGAFIGTVAVLRAGQDILVPTAIAGLIAFLLWPLVRHLRRWGLGKLPAVSLAALLAFAAIAAVGWIMGSQAMEVIRGLPRDQSNIEAKIAKLRAPHGGNSLSQVMGMIQHYEQELLGPASPPENSGNEGAPNGHPVPVQVQPARNSTLSTVGKIAAPALGPLGTAGIVAILVIAFLAQGMDLKDRLLMLAGPERRPLIRRGLEDASNRVHRYLAMQLLVNTCYGILIGLGLLLIGIPNVLLWGLLAMLLRFIPYLGPWLAACFPVILAIAIEPGWVKVAMTLGLYMVAELVTGNLIEWAVYGAATGVSGLALLLAAIFWTWLWGAAGLLLSTPMTVGLMALGRYLPGLRGFSVLFGRSEGQEGLTSERGRAKSRRDETPAPAPAHHPHS